MCVILNEKFLRQFVVPLRFVNNFLQTFFLIDFFVKKSIHTATNYIR
jgi:hypothetical protein